MLSVQCGVIWSVLWSIWVLVSDDGLLFIFFSGTIVNNSRQVTRAFLSIIVTSQHHQHTASSSFVCEMSAILSNITEKFVVGKKRTSKGSFCVLSFVILKINSGDETTIVWFYLIFVGT